MSSFRSLSGNGGMDSLSLTVPLTPHVGLGLGSGAAGVAGAASSSGPAEVRLAGVDTKEKMYEPKQRKKLVRVLTVVAYLFFVSLAAAMLSLYYVFLWNPSSKARHPTDDQLRQQEQMALREVQRIQELRRQLQLQHLQLQQRQMRQLRQQEQPPWTSTLSPDYVDPTENAQGDDLYTVEPPDVFAGEAVDNSIPIPRARTVHARPPGAVAAATAQRAVLLRHSSPHGAQARALRLD